MKPKVEYLVQYRYQGENTWFHSDTTSNAREAKRLFRHGNKYFAMRRFRILKRTITKEIVEVAK